MLVAASGAARANLIVNGDFETGDITGWTQSGGNVATGVGNLFHKGSYGYHSSSDTLGSLSQTIATTPGEKYDFSFWLANGWGGTNFFSASWDGTPVLSMTDQAGFLYTRYFFQMTAANTSTEIKFTYRHVPDFYGVDDVEVEHVPEPAFAGLIFVMLAAGLLVQFKSERA